MKGCWVVSKNCFHKVTHLHLHLYAGGTLSPCTERDLLQGVGAYGSGPCACNHNHFAGNLIADVTQGDSGARVQPPTYKTGLVSCECLIVYFICVETRLQCVHLKKSCKCVLPWGTPWFGSRQDAPGWWKSETAKVTCLYRGETSPLASVASPQSWSREFRCHWNTLKAGGKIKEGGMKTADRECGALKSELRRKR